jgi:thiamine-phosphate pyrophosphorylase
LRYLAVSSPALADDCRPWQHRGPEQPAECVMRPFDLRVYLVTDPVLVRPRGLEDTVLQAVRGGATLVQLRDKEASDADFAAQARRLIAVLRPFGVPLIVNDRVSVAREVGAEGVHVGQSDGDVRAVRAAVGADVILGLSVTNMAELEAVPEGVADYLGLGPVFATGTKPDHDPPVGLGGLAAMVRGTALPTVAIGGIGLANAAQVFATGVDGIAVVSAICSAPDPAEAAGRLLALAGPRRPS